MKKIREHISRFVPIFRLAVLLPLMIALTASFAMAQTGNNAASVTYTYKGINPGDIVETLNVTITQTSNATQRIRTNGPDELRKQIKSSSGRSLR